MEARTAWFRETGEARLKEQLLIETMFCVYYLSKGSAVLAAHAPPASPHFLLIYSLCRGGGTVAALGRDDKA